MSSTRILLSLYARSLLLFKAWRSGSRLVLIESDDWGSIRSSSPEALKTLQEKSYDLDKSVYSYDALETNDDLAALFDVLLKHKDFKGNPVCMTANVILANPDFQKIRESGFREYFFEPVESTASRLPGSDRIVSLWRDGCKKGVFIPQVHAREHVKSWTWLEALRSGHDETLETFKLDMCGVPEAVSVDGTGFFAPQYVDDSEFSDFGVSQRALIDDAFARFEEIFGFKSLSTIAPNCGWTLTTEEIWRDNSVRFIQGGYLQEHHFPGRVRYIPHYTGQSSFFGQRYLVRNCTFEPAKSKDGEYWKNTFSQVSRALALGTPAIISTHRVNYAGRLNPGMRDESLRQLDRLISEIVCRWPDVEFISSPDLGARMERSFSMDDVNEE